MNVVPSLKHPQVGEFLRRFHAGTGIKQQIIRRELGLVATANWLDCCLMDAVFSNGRWGITTEDQSVETMKA